MIDSYHLTLKATIGQDVFDIFMVLKIAWIIDRKNINEIKRRQVNIDND